MSIWSAKSSREVAGLKIEYLKNNLPDATRMAESGSR